MSRDIRSKIQPTLTLLVALQLVIVIGQWTGVGSVLTPQAAMAQIPDSGAQRAEIINELKLINANLDKIGTCLSDGKLQVHLADSDEKKGS
jgi:hypothetical protein